MINAIIPKFLIDEEDVIYLNDNGVQLTEGIQTIGDYKIPCYKFYNMSEIEVLDKLNLTLNEDNTNAQKINYATRVAAIVFLRIRQVTTIKDRDLKISAACSLLSAINSLAEIDMKYALRFIPLIRSIV